MGETAKGEKAMERARSAELRTFGEISGVVEAFLRPRDEADRSEAGRFAAMTNGR